MNSPNPNLSLLYSATHENSPSAPSRPTATTRPIGGPREPSDRHRQNVYSTVSSSQPPIATSLQSDAEALSTTDFSQPHLLSDRISDADLLLGLHSPALSGTSQTSFLSHDNLERAPTSHFPVSAPTNLLQQPPPQFTSNQTTNILGNTTSIAPDMSASTPFSDMMMIESQDIDVNGFPHAGFAFPNGEMIPWLEYLPQDVLDYFGDPVEQTHTQSLDASGQGPSAPGHNSTGNGPL